MWRADELVREARRNLGPAHGVVGLLTLLVVAAVGTLLMLQGHRALTQEAERRAGGALVWSATANDPGRPLDGATCARLTGLPGVAVAGGQAATTTASLHAFPGGMPLAVSALTPGAVQVFVPSVPWATATVGADLTALGEVGSGSWLVDDAGRRVLQLREVVAEAPVGFLTSGVTVPTAADAPLLTCWLRTEAGAEDLGGAILSAAFPDGAATVTPFLRDQAGTVTPLEQWRRTVALHPWAVGGAVIAATALLALWSRRTELAVYRTFGTPGGTVAALVACELVLVMVPATAAGVVAGSVLTAALTRTGIPPELASAALGQAGAAALCGLTVTLALAPLVGRRPISEMLRDR